MIFSSFKFIFLFLPIVFFVYNLFKRIKMYKCAKLWLVLASLYFYAQGSISFLPYFIASIMGNYVIGSTLGKMANMEENKIERRVLFLIGLFANVGLLGYYKYTNFFISNYNFFTKSEIPMKNIVLPIGISFFTFQLIAFLVDCYRGECKNYDIIEYLLFITFFPQLIVGPIIHHSEVIPQFNAPDNRNINFDNIARGLFLFTIGCSKKILLADILTNNAKGYFNSITASSVLNIYDTWFHSIEYTISYYFDLSSYADMAIGLGLLFNIIIPHNFNSPYKARNFQDYWRRWHMTLSRFLGDYIFRSVYRKNDQWRNFYVATMITFLVSGIWHGAGWTFVVWGIVNGILVCIASYMKKNSMKFPSVIAYLLTGLGIILTRVLFISPTFNYALNVYRGMFNINLSFNDAWNETIIMLKSDLKVSITLVIGILICWLLPNSKEMSERFKTNSVTLIFTSILIIICLFNMNHASSFLYFQF